MSAPSVRGLNKSLESMKDSLRNPNLERNVKTYIEAQVSRAEALLEKMENTLEGN